MKNKKSSKLQGFSLIELIFAVALFSTIVLGVMKLQTANLVLTATLNNQAKAHLLAMEGLEMAEANGSIAGIPDPNDSLFSRSFTSDPAGLAGGAAKVTAKVSWQDSSGEHFIEAHRIIP